MQRRPRGLALARRYPFSVDDAMIGPARQRTYSPNANSFFGPKPLKVPLPQ